MKLAQPIKQLLQSHPLRFDIPSILAVFMSCTLLIIYAYEFQLKDSTLIIEAGMLAHALSVACFVLRITSASVKIKHLGKIWLLCVFYGLSFFPIFAVLISGAKKYIVLNMASALLLLAVLCEWPVFLVMSPAGMIAAYVILCIIRPSEMNILALPKKKYLLFLLLSHTFVLFFLIIRKKEKQQKQKLDFMKVFGGAIAHEVNAPLASMKMMSDVMDLIIQNMKVKHKNDAYVITLDKIDYEMLTSVINEGLKKSSNDAIQIIEMLLSALRDKYTNNKAICLMSNIVDDAAAMADHLQSNGSKVKITIENDFTIVATKQLVKHAIYNLIKNSFKHGGPNVRVEIIVRDHEVIVSDNGVGIEKNKIEKIFQAFFTGGNGTGIGLPLCKFILDDMNAKISCDSEVGKCTKFKITFPCQEIK